MTEKLTDDWTLRKKILEFVKERRHCPLNCMARELRNHGIKFIDYQFYHEVWCLISLKALKIGNIAPEAYHDDRASIEITSVCKGSKLKDELEKLID